MYSTVKLQKSMETKYGVYSIYSIILVHSIVCLWHFRKTGKVRSLSLFLASNEVSLVRLFIRT